MAIDLLEQLLERNPAKRLCDPAKIKAHPYFSSIDWDKLERKEIPPPYVPPVVRACLRAEREVISCIHTRCCCSVTRRR